MIGLCYLVSKESCLLRNPSKRVKLPPFFILFLYRVARGYSWDWNPAISLKNNNYKVFLWNQEFWIKVFTLMIKKEKSNLTTKRKPQISQLSWLDGTVDPFSTNQVGGRHICAHSICVRCFNKFIRYHQYKCTAVTRLPPMFSAYSKYGQGRVQLSLHTFACGP